MFVFGLCLTGCCIIYQWAFVKRKLENSCGNKKKTFEKGLVCPTNWN